MFVIGTAGHVDHGKSALIERLTGVHPDRLQQEQERGLTIELGFGWLELPSGAEISLIDVPGHIRFVRHMLMPVTQVLIRSFTAKSGTGTMVPISEISD